MKKECVLKKIVKTVGLSFVITSSVLFVNAAEAAQKVGYISTGYIISKLPQREAIITKLQAELKDDRAELERIGAEINTKAQKIERDGELLGAEGIQKLQIEISSLQAEGNIKKEAFNKKAQSLEYKSKQQMLLLIQEAASKVAKKEDFDIVIDSQVLLFSAEGLDLTEKVLAELK